MSDSVVSLLLVSSWQAGWYRGGIPDAWYAGVLQLYSIRAKKTASSRREAPTGLQTATQNYGISTIYLRYISKNMCTYVYVRYIICQVYVIYIPLCRYKYVTHIQVWRMKYVIHLPLCRYKYVTHIEVWRMKYVIHIPLCRYNYVTHKEVWRMK